MAETEKLKLPKITGNMTWDVVRDLNALAEAVDDIAGKPDGIAVLDADGKLPAEQLGIDPSEIASKAEINEIKGDVGDKEQLSTENKTSVVDAVNEIEQKRESLEQEVATHLAEDATDAHKATNISFSHAEMTATNVNEGILEAFMLGNSRKEDLVDKLLLVDDSLPITHSSTWQEVLDSLNMISTGKKWASGVVQTTIERITVVTSSGTNSDVYFMLVSGLDFKPSTVVYTPSSGGNTSLGSTSGFLPLYQGAYQLVQPHGTSSSYRIVGNIYLSIGEFKLPVTQGGIEYSWVAFE